MSDDPRNPPATPAAELLEETNELLDRIRLRLTWLVVIGLSIVLPVAVMTLALVIALISGCLVSLSQPLPPG